MSKLKLQATDGNGGTVSLKGPASTTGNAEFELTLPGNAGSNGQVLATNGSGVLTWSNDANVGGATGVDFNDNVKARFGTGNDLELYHDATNSIIDNKTGDLYIKSVSDVFITPGTTEAGVYIRHNGAVELYYDNSKKLETYSSGVKIPDKALIGTSTSAPYTSRILTVGDTSTSDTALEIRSSSSTTGRLYFTDSSSSGEGAYQGELTFDHTSNANTFYLKINSETSLKAVKDAQVELNYNGSKKLETQSGGVQVFGNLQLDDGKVLNLGTSSDLSLQHDGNNSYIATGGVGSLYIRTSTSDNAIKCVKDAAVELYYDNSKKFETTANGIKFYDTSGNQVGETFDGGMNFTSLVWVDNLRLLDSEKIELGSSQDLQIYHDGSHSYIKDAGTGNLIIRNGNDDAIICYTDGSVDLFHNNSLRFQTDSAGVVVKGPEGGDAHLYLYADEGDDDADKWRFQAYSSSSKLILQNKASGGWESNFEALGNGAIKLDYDNSTKFETTSSGISVSGDVVASGHVGPLADNKKLILGTSSDIEFYSSGANGYLANSTGELYVKSGVITLRGTNNEQMFKGTMDGASELMYNGTKKFETLSSGSRVTGELQSDSLIMGATSHTFGGTEPLLELVSNSTTTGPKITLYNGQASAADATCEIQVGQNYRESNRIIFGRENAADWQSANGSTAGFTAFWTNTGGTIAERVRITAAGSLLVGTSTNSINTSAFGVEAAAHGRFYTSRNVNGSSGTMQNFGNAGEHRVMGDGDVYNTNNTYGSISDQTLKQDIVDAASQWDDIKQVKIRKFRFKDNPTAPLHIGVVAQELETVSPGLVKDQFQNGKDGDKVKSVKYSVLYLHAIKALQEAMAKIETLETKVAALGG